MTWSKYGMNFAFSICLASAIIMSAGSCYYDNEEELYGITVCDTTAVSYKDQIDPIMQNSCAISGCHEPRGSGNGLFINYEGVKEKVDNGSMHERVVVLRDMPVGFAISDCQVDLIDSWINAGAPNN